MAESTKVVPPPATNKRMGRPPASQRSVRLQVSLPESLVEQLQEIGTVTHKDSVPEILKDALRLYAHLINKHKDGQKFLTQKSGEQPVELALFI